MSEKEAKDSFDHAGLMRIPFHKCESAGGRDPHRNKDCRLKFVARLRPTRRRRDDRPHGKEHALPW